MNEQPASELATQVAVIPNKRNTSMTVAEMLKQIPSGWRDAEIAIGTTIGDAEPVRRVALHQNADGRRVVVICEYPLKVLALILLAALLCAASAQAQPISLTPSNYSLSIRVENNVGRWRASWQSSSVDTIVLSNRVLTFTHSVCFRGVPSYGTALGGPNKLEDSYSYRQVGGATYWPVGGENITFFAQRKDGSWIAQTNYVIEADMGGPIFFLPAFIGTLTTGDAYTRTVTTGSPLVMSGRNLLNLPYLLQITCGGEGEVRYFLCRFEANERKLVTMGTGGLEFILFDLDATTGREL